LGAGFLELEEFDQADFGIVGGVVEDCGTGEGKVGKERGKKKQQKRKRGGHDQGPSGDGDGDLVVEGEHCGEARAEARGCNVALQQHCSLLFFLTHCMVYMHLIFF
jgi:ATP-dependent RNA helicase DDX24/MAK5